MFFSLRTDFTAPKISDKILSFIFLHIFLLLHFSEPTYDTFNVGSQQTIFPLVSHGAHGLQQVSAELGHGGRGRQFPVNSGFKSHLHFLNLRHERLSQSSDEISEQNSSSLLPQEEQEQPLEEHVFLLPHKFKRQLKILHISSISHDSFDV